MAKQFFKDLPDTTTPLTAGRINGLLDGEEAMGSIVVDDVNCKNLCDGVFESGNINDSGQETTSTTTMRSVNYIEVKGGETYICSYTATSGTKLNVVACYDANKTFVTRLTNLGTNPFTLGSTVKYIRLGMYNLNGISTSDFSNVQLELGSTATNFVEYKQPVKQKSYGVKESCTFYADDFKCKNLFAPTLVVNGVTTNVTRATVTLDKDEFTFVASGTDMYFGNITNSGNTYSENRGQLIDVSGANKISVTVTNPDFNLCLVTKYDSSKTSLGYTTYTTNSFVSDIPSNCKYITLRFGKNDAVSGTTYKTKVQIEKGGPTPYTPYKQFENNDIYSAGEQIIGTWIDGKPLYRIVVETTSPSAVDTSTSIHTVSNMNVTKIDGMLHYSSSVEIPLNFYQDASHSIATYKSSGSNISMRVTASSYTSKDVTLILEYTKTTDV